MPFLSNPISLVRKLYELACPYGRKKLAIVFAVIVVQGLLQVVGVTSIFPFLALASNPGQARDSEIGAAILGKLPAMSDDTLLIIAGLLAILMLFLSNGMLLLGEVVRIRYSQGLGHFLRLRLLSRIVDNPYGYFLQRNTGELLKKAVTDVNMMVGNVLQPLLDGTSRFLTVLLLLGTVLFVDPVLALAATAGLGGFYCVIFAFLKKRRFHYSETFKVANRGAMREAQQLLGGIKPIKVHQREASFIDRYARHSFMQAVLQKWGPIYQNSPRYLVEPLAFGGLVATVLVLAAQGNDFISLLPKLGVMTLAAYRLLPNLQLIYGSATGVSLNTHTVEEVYEEFAEDATLAKKTPFPPAPLAWSRQLRVEDLTFRYPGTETPLFKGLNLTIQKNQFVALVGATGSGKSTLVDLLLGLHTPDAGRIVIDDTSLTPANIPVWRAGLGYVPQDIFLLDDTLAANIAFGRSAKEIDLERVAEVARIAQIASFIETELPHCYQSQVGERGVRLSGGQRQRIGLARALYHRPTTLILDEATSALDNVTEEALMRAIEALHGEITLIVIAHRLSTIEKADHIFELEQGHVVRQGSFNEVRTPKARHATADI